MKTIINQDLSSISITDNEKFECILPNYNPETGVLFSSDAEILDYVKSIEDKSNFWSIRLSDEEKQQIVYDQKAKEIRVQRNQLLVESDWTQVSDAPVDKQAWATYRQELRDITTQEGFPFEVIFPVKPE